MLMWQMMLLEEIQKEDKLYMVEVRLPMGFERDNKGCMEVERDCRDCRGYTGWLLV